MGTGVTLLARCRGYKLRYHGDTLAPYVKQEFRNHGRSRHCGTRAERHGCRDPQGLMA
jgi:hypothetical protein